MKQRKFLKRLSLLNKKHFDKCTLCRKHYNESCHTFAGVDVNGDVQSVGYCCKDKMNELWAGGVFVSMDMSSQEASIIRNKLAATHPLYNMFHNPTGNTKYIETKKG